MKGEQEINCSHIKQVAFLERIEIYGVSNILLYFITFKKQNDCYRSIYIVCILASMTPKFVNCFRNDFVRKMFIGAENGLYDIFAYVHGR